MLPRSRILSILLVGVGMALLAACLAAPRIFHFEGRVPIDSENTTITLRDPAARARIIADPEAGVVDTPLQKQLHARAQQSSDDSVATVRVGDSLVRSDQDSDQEGLLTASVWSFGIDRRNGAINTPMRVSAQIASPAQEAKPDGWWLYFPPDVQTTSYNLFDDTLRSFYPAEYQGEEEVSGRTAYHFSQKISPTNVAQSYAGPFDTTRLEDGTEGYLFHSVDRELWVDQETGILLAMEENVDDYYGTAHGERKDDALAFHGTMSQEDIAARAADAQRAGGRSTAEIIVLILQIVGIILVIIGLVGSLWPGRRHKA